MDLTSVVPNYVPEICTDIVLYLRRDSYSVQGCCPFCKIIQTCHGLIYPCWSLARKLTSAKTCRLATFPPSILLLESSSCRYRVNNLLCSMDIATIFIKKLSSYGTTVGLMKFVAALYIVLMVSSTNSEHRSTVCSLYFFLLTKINKNENYKIKGAIMHKIVSRVKKPPKKSFTCTKPPQKCFTCAKTSQKCFTCAKTSQKCFTCAKTPQKCFTCAKKTNKNKKFHVRKTTKCFHMEKKIFTWKKPQIFFHM